jgi:hypothetical protein
MTQNLKRLAPSHVLCRFEGRDSLILVDHATAVDKGKLVKRLGEISEVTQKAILRVLNGELNLLKGAIIIELNKAVELEEDRYYEFKEVKGIKPADTIKNTADEYAVSFLNSEGGKVFWGIRNADRVVVGVKVNSQERDKIRTEVSNKLAAIRPHLDPSSFRITFSNVYDNGETVPDLYVVELDAPSGHPLTLYFTGGDEAFVRVDGVKRKLKGPAIQEWITNRIRQVEPIPSTSGVNLDLKLRREDKEITSKRHDYVLVVEVINSGSVKVNDFMIDALIPSAYIDRDSSGPLRIFISDEGKHRRFRFSPDLAKRTLYPGDPLTVMQIGYFVDWQIKTSEAIKEKAIFRIYADGMETQTIEVPMKELMNF